MRRTILLIVTLLLTLLASTAKDDYRYRSLTMDDGLPSNAVRNIVQDSRGFIWLGTDNGLCRYDGTRIQQYRISELGMNQYVSALLACDEGLYIGTEKGVFQLRFDRQGERAMERLPMDIHSTVTCLTKDKEGNLWVATQAQGAWCYSGGHSASVKCYAFDQVGGLVSQVFVDRYNQVWAVSNADRQPVSRLNRLHGQFEPVSLSNSDGCGSLCMTQTRDGRLWLGSWENGLLLLHSDGRVEQMFKPEQLNMGSHIHTLFERSDDCLCIGSDEGLICFNPKTRECRKGLSVDGRSTSGRLQGKNDQRFVYAVIGDTEGGIWIGTFYGGVSYVSPVGRRFEGFAGDGTPGGLQGSVISRFCEDRQGRVWIASDDGGLMCYLPQQQRFTDYAGSSQLRQANAHALCLDGSGNLWIGTYTDGVLVMNPETGQLRRYTQTSDPKSLDGSSSYAIFRDIRDRIWVATMDGLCRYAPDHDQFERIGKVGALTIDIDEDWQGNLWLSTQGGGLIRYDQQSQTLRPYRHDDRDGKSLADDQVNCTLVDESGRLWVGTLDGLCLYDARHDRFDRIPLDVPDRNIMGIIEDHGALWLSTNKGIVKYEPSQQGDDDRLKSVSTNVQRFTLHDGLVSEQFQPNACLRSNDGRIYFGSTNGFNAFFPYQIKANATMPPVYITAMQILNREEHTAEGLPLDLSQTSEITIGYGDNRMVSFSFASLSYCSPEKNQYAYKLEGFDQDWNHVGNQTKATYTNLPPGTYTLRVKATNNDGIWSDHEATLLIEVNPPFWWTWWAKLAYILLLCAAIWYYVQYRLRRAERRHQREMQRLEEEKEKEVREARLNFFTMIAHEIRTPVSLIIGPLEGIMRNEKLGMRNDDYQINAEKAGMQGNQHSSFLIPHSSLEIINRNAHRLLELVNQLLDFRKVEQQSLVMHFAPQNIHELIRSVSERFAPTFEQGGLHFTVGYPDERFTAMVDREAVTKVVSNLLTNANKYTRDDVRLSCSVDPDGRHFRIIVSDNGVGIRQEDRQRIFEPFFQAEGNKPGTGIGLNIVKSIVDQHHGEISVESELGQGSTFTVVLPVRQDEMRNEECGMRNDDYQINASQSNAAQADAVQASADGVQGNQHFSFHIPHSSFPKLLLVDDSDDMRSFLANNFRDQYEVLTASDGLEALDLLSKHEVEIIISDWMMPRMDGAELCRRVRSNPLTSHIPFVMLTAKTDDDSKVEGMDVGADTYIEKPFSVQYLEACIRNMLRRRRQLIEKFATQPLEPVTEIAQNPTDNAFLLRMNRVIEENFSNTELSVGFLADQLNISRSGLFAKLKVLADVTPNEMIQLVRLKRAAQLLAEGSYSVGEIGYMVGFSSPSYFSKCFLKQFGVRPAEYMKSAPSFTSSS